MEKEIICIVCPKGCRIKASEQNGELIFSGNGCKRGPIYVEAELRAPERMLTTTVEIKGALYSRLPVVSERPLPKGKVLAAVTALRDTVVNAPVKMGDVIYNNILGLGIDIIASKSLDKEGKL